MGVSKQKVLMRVGRNAVGTFAVMESPQFSRRGPYHGPFTTRAEAEAAAKTLAEWYEVEAEIEHTDQVIG